VVSTNLIQVGMELTTATLHIRGMRFNGSVARSSIADAAQISTLQNSLQSFLLLTLAALLVLAARPAHPQQQDKSMANMPGMDMSGDMKDMGPSMAAMAGHMYITPLRPKQPGDEDKVKALVAQVKASIERYKDYHQALADGYVIGNPF
jgi:hypothetical protein